MAVALIIRLLCLAIVALAIVLSLGGCDTAKPTLSDPLPVTIRGRTFRLELAMTDADRIQGLSDRRELAADGGMLFVFPSQQPLAFVMRRCYVPIDVIFLDGGGRVVNTHAMQVEPEATFDDDATLRPYPSDWPAQFAIELKGGTLKSLELRRGEKIDLPLEELKRNAR
jgi:uncharacterized membrane protein (UPF0127 family)